MISTVVGYGGFKSYSDKPYSNLKSGQATLDRDYYAHANQEVPNGKVTLANFGRFNSVYNENISATVAPGDYKVPLKNANTMLQYEYSHNPELYKHTKAAKQQEMRRTAQQFGQGSTLSSSNALGQAGATSMGFNQSRANQTQRSSAQQFGESNKEIAGPTSHWKSTYTGVVEDTLSKPVTRAQRPLWSLPRQAYTSDRGFFQTEYMQSLGTYGHNPRTKLNESHNKMYNEVHDLTVGTTKTTNHIPGYNGFIPRTDLNPTAVEHGSGQNERHTIIKQNIVENYQVKLPGYQGHMPMSVVNDRGTIRPMCLSTQGEHFH